jgi:hypothetical protein
MEWKLDYGRLLMEMGINSISGTVKREWEQGVVTGLLAQLQDVVHALGMVEWPSGCLRISDIKWEAQESTNQ